MRTKGLALVAAAVLSASAHAQAWTSSSAGGTLVVVRPVASAFPHAARDAGYNLNGVLYPREGHYDDASVAVFVPPGYIDGPRANLVVFFHGWYSSVDDSLTRFRLLDQFVRSGVNALLLVPETAKNAPDSFAGKLEQPGGFQALVQEMLSLLRARGLVRAVEVGTVVVAGHSGAYRALGQIVDHGGRGAPVKAVLLFDALYGGLDAFGGWTSRGGRLFSVFSDEGETAELNLALMRDLEARGLAYVLGSERDLGRTPLPENAGFYHSARGHFGVVADADQFAKLLQGLGLSRAPLPIDGDRRILGP